MISGSSLEMTSKAAPLQASWSSRSCISALAPTSTPRRFVHNEDAAGAGQPFGEGDFLLVAAAQAGHLIVEARGFDPKLLNELARRFMLFTAANEAGRREFRKGRQRSVLDARHGEDEAL